MSEYIEITGGKPLSGEIRVTGAKNAALPLLIASLLTDEPCRFTNVPNLDDVYLTLHLLEHFGCSPEFRCDEAVVHTPKLQATEASYSLVKALRASFWVLAPLLARGGAARVALPGGDIIGARPVDIHLEALKQMGADIRLKHGIVYATAVDGLKPAEVNFRFPSVGATHQVLMAAALTPGHSRIIGAAREPEIVALAEMLNSMGAEIEGAGTSEINIQGARELHGVEVNLVGDRIAAGTYLLAGVASRGAVTVKGCRPEDLTSFCQTLERIGVRVERYPDGICVQASGVLNPVRVATQPHPGFPTDLQAPLMAALATVSGESTIEESVFEGRFGHVAELGRMGAQITVKDRIATVRGVTNLIGAPVEALDIRAGAALVIAAVAAEGTTKVQEIHHLRRGYELLEENLSTLGAHVRTHIGDAEDFMFTGC